MKLLCILIILLAGCTTTHKPAPIVAKSAATPSFWTLLGNTNLDLFRDWGWLDRYRVRERHWLTVTATASAGGTVTGRFSIMDEENNPLPVLTGTSK